MLTIRPAPRATDRSRRLWRKAWLKIQMNDRMAQLSPEEQRQFAARYVEADSAAARQREVARLVLALADRLDPDRKLKRYGLSSLMIEKAEAFESQHKIHVRRGSVPVCEPELTLHSIMLAWRGYRGQNGQKSIFPSDRTLREILAAR